MDEVQSVKVVGQIGSFLERILRRNDQPNLIKIGPVCYVIGNDHMPGMYRVERTKKQANCHKIYFTITGITSMSRSSSLALEDGRSKEARLGVDISSMTSSELSTPNISIKNLELYAICISSPEY